MLRIVRAHTLIVGGGVMGVSIAAHLAALRDPVSEPVVLLERRRLGSGSSGRSGAVLRTFYSSRELIGVARDSLREYARFETRYGRAIGFTRCGVLSIAGTQAQADLARRNHQLMRDCAVAAELVDAPQIRALVAGVEVAEHAVGVWEPAGGFVDPQRTVEAFAAIARDRGATIREHAEVVRIQVEGGRVVRVAAEDECYDVEQVVLAAGPWSTRVLAQCGVELPLRTVRPEQHFVRMPAVRTAFPKDAESSEGADGIEARFAAPPEPAAAHPVLLDLEKGFYTRCEPSRGRTRVGALDYERDRVLRDADELDECVSDDFRRWARERLVSRLPRYLDQPDDGAQAAWYTLTPDAQALIGPCPGLANAFVATGFSGHGFKLAPSIGEGVAQMLTGVPVSAFEPHFFAPGRFGGAPQTWSGAFGL